MELIAAQRLLVVRQTSCQGATRRPGGDRKEILTMSLASSHSSLQTILCWHTSDRGGSLLLVLPVFAVGLHGYTRSTANARGEK